MANGFDIFCWQNTFFSKKTIKIKHRGNFYRKMVDELSVQMTLPGQEARIQLRYYLPDHFQNDLYTKLCQDYKNLSQEQLDKHKE